MTARSSSIPGARAALTTLVVVGGSLIAAGCGDASTTAGVAHLSPGEGSSSASSDGSGSSPESTASPGQAMVAFAKCMRSNGVPSFPDPNAGGGFQIGGGVNPSSPAFKAAQAKCQKLMPGGGPPGPGSTTHPSAQTLAGMLKVSQCMRQHGVSGFPDPTTSVPSLTGAGVIADREGAIFALPAAIMQSPGFTQAAAACGFGLHNH